MKNNAYCPICGETEYKNVDSKPVCRKCGYVVSEEEIESDIKARFLELSTKK